MYIHVPGPKQVCSQCGAVDNTEHVRKNGFQFTRCCVCKHEGPHTSTMPQQTRGSLGRAFRFEPPGEEQF